MYFLNGHPYFQDMGKTTSAERMRKLREKLKQDQDKFENYKEKERARDKKRREKLKIKNTLSATSAQECRLKEAERKKRYRHKIKLEAKECTDMLNYTPNSNLGSFKCPQSLGKAVKRLQNVLLASPRKTKAVIQKLVYINFPNVARKIFDKPVPKKRLFQKIPPLWCESFTARMILAGKHQGSKM